MQKKIGEKENKIKDERNKRETDINRIKVKKSEKKNRQRKTVNN